jgi:hypothetical protein
LAGGSPLIGLSARGAPLLRRPTEAVKRKREVGRAADPSDLAIGSAELHAKLLAHIAPRLEGIELRLYEIEGRRYRVPPRFNDVLRSGVDELAFAVSRGPKTRLVSSMRSRSPDLDNARQRRGPRAAARTSH